ncbi:MAG: LacI family DNA-binding transcriptional regulator [Arachnia sp.]
MANSHDVARHAGVSRSQVSNFFNRPELVSAAKSARIKAAADELGYVPNEAARRLRRQRSESIGVVFTDAWDPFFDYLARGIQSEAEQEGWFVQFTNSHRDPVREARNIEHLEAQMNEAVIVFPTGDVDEQVKRLMAHGVVVVLLDPPDIAAKVPVAPSVAVDHVLGARLAAEHLIERGGRRPAFVGNPESVRHVANRHEGFRLGWGALAEPRLFRTDGLSVTSGIEVGQEILALPADERPDAILAANDLVAFGLLQTLARGGVRVPEDTRIVGYDDVQYASEIEPNLTTVYQPAADLGRTAVRLAIEAARGDRPAEHPHILFDPVLVVRDTS